MTLAYVKNRYIAATCLLSSCGNQAFILGVSNVNLTDDIDPIVMALYVDIRDHALAAQFSEAEASR